MKLDIGSLFSGIGGFELGLERAGLGPTRWQVEQDPLCRAILATHWPDVQRFPDVRHVGAAQLAPVGVLCGGFPCQDLSAAGRRAGLDGERSGLYREMLRIIEEIRPPWAIFENVAHTWARWVPVVRRELRTRGYESLPFRIRASDVGARHERARVFVVAAHPDRLKRLSWAECARTQGPGGADLGRGPATNPHDQGHVCERRSRNEGGRRADYRAETAGGAHAAHPAGVGLAIREGLQAGQREEQPTAARGPEPDDPTLLSPGWGLPPSSWLVRDLHGISARLDVSGWPAGWTPARLRAAQIAALGNTVVPAQVEPFGRAILAAEAAYQEVTC